MSLSGVAFSSLLGGATIWTETAARRELGGDLEMNELGDDRDTPPPTFLQRLPPHKVFAIIKFDGMEDLRLQGCVLAVRWELMRRTDPTRPWQGLSAQMLVKIFRAW